MRGTLIMTSAFPARGHGISHGIRAHDRTCWLNNVISPDPPDTTIIGTVFHPVNDRESIMPPLAALVLGVLALVAWVLLTYVVPAGLGAVHALLAVGMVLLVYWWARRH